MVIPPRPSSTLSAPIDMRFNNFHWGIVHGLAWVVCLADGWVLHNHVLFGMALFFMFYSLWRMIMKTPEDEEFERIAREQEARDAEDLRKTQPVVLSASIQSFNAWEHSHQPNQYSIERRAYLAGFDAGRRQERLKEIND